MGLLQHQGGHQQQNGSIGHQLQKSDALQAVEHPPGKGPVFIALALLRVPLAQPGGKKEDDRNLGKLRGLELDPQLQPPPGLVVGHSQWGKHQDQKDDRANQGGHGHPAKSLIVDLGDHEHPHHAHRPEQCLAGDIHQRVPVRIVGGGVRGGEHHDQPDPQQQQHQHQEGQVQGPPGQLLLHSQISFWLSGHGAPPLRSACAAQPQITWDTGT